MIQKATVHMKNSQRQIPKHWSPLEVTLETIGEKFGTSAPPGHVEHHVCIGVEYIRSLSMKAQLVQHAPIDVSKGLIPLHVFFFDRWAYKIRACMCAELLFAEATGSL